MTEPYSPGATMHQLRRRMVCVVRGHQPNCTITTSDGQRVVVLDTDVARVIQLLNSPATPPRNLVTGLEWSCGRCGAVEGGNLPEWTRYSDADGWTAVAPAF